MKTNKNLEIMMGVIGLIPIIYLWYVWAYLPEVVPTHFSLNGQADGYSSKLTLVLILLGMGVLPLGLKFILALDPAKQSILNSNNLQKIRLVISIFMSFIGIIAVKSGLEGKLSGSIDTLIAPGMLILMAFLGNYMTNLRPNYMAGIRTPWTLANQNVWRKTHLLGGRLMFGLCLAAVLPCVFLPMPYNLSLAAVVILIASFYPIYYSYKIREAEDKS
jgi:uncharacterized membrane protein